MRNTLALLACLTPALALAQAPVRLATVKADHADLLAKPSDKPELFVTDRLPRGSTVQVVGEGPGGWVKVKPAAGSVSMIYERFLTPVSGNGKVRAVAAGAESVPVYVSSKIRTSEQPSVVGAEVKSGTILTCVGQPFQATDGSTCRWVLSPPGEVRYVRAADLQAAPPGPVIRAVGATPTDLKTPASALPIARTPSANKSQATEELWREAYTAHVNKRYEEAARLYEEAAGAAASTRPALAAHASREAQKLRAWLAAQSRASAFTTPGAASTSAQLRDPSPATTERERPTPVGVYRGRLRVAGWSIDGRPGYFLDVYVPGRLRQPGFYVTAGPGINLAAWAGRDVEVSGAPPAYRGDLRAYYLVATRIQLYR